MTRPLLLLLPLLLTLTACDPATVAGGPDAGDDDDTPYAPPAPWADLSFTERIVYMEEIVEPTMRELFQEFDPIEFADFGCETCHGPDATDIEFDLPNGVTPISFPLDVSEPGVAEQADFMDEVVKPEMAALVDKEPFPSGSFGCFACHERD
jgi:hypothetical protein